MNVKRGSDGQPLPKNDHSNAAPPTRIKDLLNKGPELLASKPKTKRKTVTKNKFSKTGTKRNKTVSKKPEKQALKDITEEYYLMLQLANSSTGLPFGQLLRADSVEAKKQIELLLSPRG